MKEIGYSDPCMKRLACTMLLLFAFACGGNPPPPASTPAPEAAPPPPKQAEPVAAPEKPAPPPTPGKVDDSEPTPEKCDIGWICVKVSLDKKTVEKRETKLIGDPKIPETWSKTSDGRAVSFDAFSKGPIEVMLRRKPGDKNEVVVKQQKTEIVIDRRDGTIDDFTHVGIIAAEQDGAFLVDLRYMK